MPASNAAKAKTTARKRVSKRQNVNQTLIKEIDVETQNDDGTEKTNFEFIQGLPYEKYCLVLEYIFLLREVYGVDGFLRNIKCYKANYDDAWKDIYDSGIYKMFGGKRKGFMRDWLVPSKYEKLRKQDLKTLAAFLTYFNITPSYRKQIVVGKRHQIILINHPSEKIIDWLNEV